MSFIADRRRAARPRPFVLRCTLALGLLLAMGAQPRAHGGAYRGPGDALPPSASSPSGAPSPGAGAGAGAPTSSTPGTPTPGAPTAPGTAGLAAIPSAPPPPDLDDWRLWWGYNSAAFLDLRAAVRHSDLLLGSSAFFLGKRPRDQARDLLVPSAKDVAQRIVPALLAVLEDESDVDMITGALVALAKIGEQASGGRGLAQRFAPFLGHGNQEVAETAALCLGILADASSVSLLAHLLEDDEEARRRLGDREVPLRTRAFAAYGLGLIGHRVADESLRVEIVKRLVRCVEEGALALPTPDVAVACLSAMGLVPLATDGKGPGRAGQVRWLLALGERRDLDRLVAAHVPTALARLLTKGPAGDGEAASLRALVGWRWLEAVRVVGQRSRELEQSLVLALGRIGDGDEEDLDRHLRATLGELATRSRNPSVRRFALIALAQVAGRPGAGPRAPAGETGAREAVARELLERLEEERSPDRPWAALALGVLGPDPDGDGQALAARVDRALVGALAAARAPREVGAFAVACGMRRAPGAAPVLLEQLERVHDDETRGYVTLALGMSGAVESLEPIARLVERSRYRPDLLRQSAISLGLLGDKDLVPSLIEMLRGASSLSAQASIASALGAIGDARSIDPLLEMLGDEEVTPRARAFAAVSLGLVADKEERPWNAKLAIGINYRASTATLFDGAGAGVLEIL